MGAMNEQMEIQRALFVVFVADEMISPKLIVQVKLVKV